MEIRRAVEKIVNRRPKRCTGVGAAPLSGLTQFRGRCSFSGRLLGVLPPAPAVSASDKNVHQVCTKISNTLFQLSTMTVSRLRVSPPASNGHKTVDGRRPWTQLTVRVWILLDTNLSYYPVRVRSNGSVSTHFKHDRKEPIVRFSTVGVRPSRSKGRRPQYRAVVHC